MSGLRLRFLPFAMSGLCSAKSAKAWPIISFKNSKAKVTFSPVDDGEIS